MYDIFYIAKDRDQRFLDLQKKIPLLKLAKYEEKASEGFFTAQKKAVSKFFWVVDEGFDVNENFEFNYEVPAWDSPYVHVFRQENGNYGGVYLIPKEYRITKKESDYSFFVNKKDIDIVFGSYPPYEQFFVKNPEDFFEAQKQCKTSMFYALEQDFKLKDDFDYIVQEWDKTYVHTFKEKDQKHGIVHLIPKDYPITKKETEYNFFVNKKEFEEIVSEINYDKFVIDSPEDYFKAQEQCKTTMFYAIDKDYAYVDSFKFDLFVEEWDKKYVYVFKTEDGRSGKVYLIPKDYPITQKEAEYSFFVNKKEIDVVASKLNYDKFTIKKPEDYFDAQQKCKTTMFYAVEIDYKPTFDYDFIVPEHDREYVHIFKYEGDVSGGAYIIPKDYHITKKETEYGFFVSRKQIDIEVSKLQFDIVFISYNEPNADKNYEELISKFPFAKRIHGVKGIHQAHIEAAKLCETTMFWVVDGDAIIADDFNFSFNVQKWDRDTVHVFKSKNPINDLIYGYGGVKLLPTELVLKMDVNSVDMTTSISKKFKSIDRVSNITGFNTDPFNTWKSAFRECVKLSSKVIDGQIDEQTQERLDIWCSVGSDRAYGEYAIKGAIAGKQFGLTNSLDKEMLSKINDWKWLQDEFKKY